MRSSSVFRPARDALKFAGSPRSMMKQSSEIKSMSAPLTEIEFSRHLNSKFMLKLDGQPEIELELVEVKGYLPQESEHQGMERFSIFFDGPGTYLRQRVYHLEHDQMGEIELFLVPISGDQRGYRYEAVFNYFKT